MTWALPRETCRAYGDAILALRERLRSPGNCGDCRYLYADQLADIAAKLAGGSTMVPKLLEPERGPDHAPRCERYAAPTRASFPICPECRMHVRLGGEVDPITGSWFHLKCRFDARNRRAV